MFIHVIPVRTCYASELVLSIISDVIYVIGGCINGVRVNTFQSYDMKTQEWRILKPMFEKRSSHAVCLQGDQIIVAGGHNGSDYLDTCENYDTNSNRFVFPILSELHTGV